jgi:hypothetical protein
MTGKRFLSWATKTEVDRCIYAMGVSQAGELESRLRHRLDTGPEVDFGCAV